MKPIGLLLPDGCVTEAQGYANLTGARETAEEAASIANNLVVRGVKYKDEKDIVVFKIDEKVDDELVPKEAIDHEGEIPNSDE